MLAGLLACSGSDQDADAGGNSVAGSNAAGARPSDGGATSGGAPSSSSADGGEDTTAMAGSVADAGAAGAASGGGGGEGGAAGEGAGAELGGAGTGGVCSAVTGAHELDAGVHVAACSEITYSTNPPSSGEHYPSWADFGVYDFPLPRGYWVHNLEHGAVVVTYNCPAGCDDDVERASAWLAQLTPDAACSTGPARVLLVPDPLLDVPWAASAWGFTLRADCFDVEAFSTFVSDHVGQPTAPEYTLCNVGVDFRADGAETCGAN
jgi:hypothetical protein